MHQKDQSRQLELQALLPVMAPRCRTSNAKESMDRRETSSDLSVDHIHCLELLPYSMLRCKR